MNESREHSGWVWLPLTVAVIALDQLSKLWIVQHFQPYERKHLLPVLDITLWFNEGAAFSFLSEASGWQRWLFTGLAILVGAGLVYWMKRLKGPSGCCAVPWPSSWPAPLEM
jgi:signal peptidase II